MTSVRDLKQIVTKVRSESKKKGIAGTPVDFLEISEENAVGSNLHR